MNTRESLNLMGYDDSFSQMPSADIVSSVFLLYRSMK